MKTFSTTLTLIATLFFANTSFAHPGGDHTPNYCNNEKTVCAHLMFPKPINTIDEAQFVAHFLTKNQLAVTNVSIELWMDMGGHGHGSAPVIVTEASPNHYQVTNAFFIMAGQWQVKLYFEHEDKKQQLIIPVVVK